DDETIAPCRLMEDRLEFRLYVVPRTEHQAGGWPGAGIFPIPLSPLPATGSAHRTRRAVDGDGWLTAGEREGVSREVALFVRAGRELISVTRTARLIRRDQGERDDKRFAGVQLARGRGHHMNDAGRKAGAPCHAAVLKSTQA